MVKKILIGIAILVVLIGAAWFVSYYPLIAKQPDSAGPAQTPTQTQTQAINQKVSVAPTEKPMVPPGVTGIPAIKAYAAAQFNMSADKLVVVSSSEKDWPDSCLGLTISGSNEKGCIEGKVHGFEVTFKIDGRNLTYRGSEDGKNIRIVKQ